MGEPVKHPYVEGIYAQEYRVPAYDGRGNFFGYKDIPNPKTYFDPNIISNEQMIQYSTDIKFSETELLMPTIDVSMYTTDEVMKSINAKGYFEIINPVVIDKRGRRKAIEGIFTIKRLGV